jgi:hypothetical protein
MSVEIDVEGSVRKARQALAGAILILDHCTDHMDGDAFKRHGDETDSDAFEGLLEQLQVVYKELQILSELRLEVAGDAA